MGLLNDFYERMPEVSIMQPYIIKLMKDIDGWPKQKRLEAMAIIEKIRVETEDMKKKSEGRQWDY